MSVDLRSGRHAWLLLSMIVLAILTCFRLAHSERPSNPTEGLQRYEFRQIQMGTLFRIVIYTDSESRGRQAAREALERIEELDYKLSDYRPESELMRLSRKAAGRPVEVSPDLFFVLERAQYFSEISGGAFDVTVKPLVDLWRTARSTKQLPSRQLIHNAQKKVDYRNVLLDVPTRSVSFRTSGIDLDLGGIAKGYAADQALKILKGYGIDRALIDAGGDLRLGAAPPEKKGWTVRLDEITKDEANVPVLHLSNTAIAVSSDRYQFVEIDGTRYSHIVDPSTGLGLRTSRTVTVIAPDALTADALATALSVLAPEKSLKLAGRLQKVAVRILLHSKSRSRLFASPGFPP